MTCPKERAAYVVATDWDARRQAAKTAPAAPAEISARAARRAEFQALCDREALRAHNAAQQQAFAFFGVKFDL